VALRYTASGTYEGSVEGAEPTGRPFNMSSMAMVRVADGVIAEKWVRVDALGLL
jgi:predicted ester cyclase